MKTLRTLSMATIAIAVALCTSSCKKEKIENENSGNVPMGEKMRIEASINTHDGNSKTSIGNDGKVFWSNEDIFMLYSGANGEEFELDGASGTQTAAFEGVSPGDAPYYAFYPAEVVCTKEGTFTYEVPSDQTDITENAGPMAAYSEDGKNIQFENAMSWIYIGLKSLQDGEEVTRVELTDNSNAKLHGTLTVTVDDENNVHSSFGSDGTNQLYVEPTQPVALDKTTPKYFKFLVPAGAFNGPNKVSIKVYFANSTSRTFTRSFPSGGVAANMIYTADINYGFTVAADANKVSTKRVLFSSGNLQYKPNTDEWRFAPEQWDRADENVGSPYSPAIGDAVINVKYSQTGTDWIGLFSWGTSNYAHGALSYQPWSHDGLGTSANDHYKAYGDINKDLCDGNGSADWGYGRTFDGKTGWRTMTGAEWECLGSRRLKANALSGQGNINGVNGAIIMPDDWSLDWVQGMGVGFTPALGYSTNTYTVEQWRVLESTGAIFLPAAGARDSNTTHQINNVNVQCWYWSATHDGYTAPSGAIPNQFSAAYAFIAADGFVFWNYGENDRSDGFSVRLVRNVP